MDNCDKNKKILPPPPSRNWNVICKTFLEISLQSNTGMENVKFYTKPSAVVTNDLLRKHCCHSFWQNIKPSDFAITLQLLIYQQPHSQFGPVQILTFSILVLLISDLYNLEKIETILYSIQPKIGKILKITMHMC